MTKVAIICGAGSTLSDAVGTTSTNRPPLDRGFFRICRRLKLREYEVVSRYMRDAYGIDVCSGTEDSLEQIMAVLYSDLLNPAVTANDAAVAFRAYLRLINRRIAETTNRIQPGQKSYLYRVLRSLLLDHGVEPNNISIITFNYDLHIERTLQALQRSSSIRKSLRPLLTFPFCYRLTSYQQSNAPKSVSKFSLLGKAFSGIEILKLHGSLNWFSVHKTSSPSPHDLIRKDHKLWITARQKVPVDMTITIAKKQQYTFPLVVPPVVNKASILHNSMAAIWTRALECLSEANNVIVYGYSCPLADQESANLMTRALRNSSELESLSIIDPSTSAFDRFAALTNASIIHYYRTARTYLSAV